MGKRGVAGKRIYAIQPIFCAVFACNVLFLIFDRIPHGEFGAHLRVGLEAVGTGNIFGLAHVGIVQHAHCCDGFEGRAGRIQAGGRPMHQRTRFVGQQALPIFLDAGAFCAPIIRARVQRELLRIKARIADQRPNRAGLHIHHHHRTDAPVQGLVRAILQIGVDRKLQIIAGLRSVKNIVLQILPAITFSAAQILIVGIFNPCQAIGDADKAQNMAERPNVGAVGDRIGTI